VAQAAVNYYHERRHQFITVNESPQEAYQKWLKQQVEEGVLTVPPEYTEAPWLSKYITAAHTQGVTSAYASTQLSRGNLVTGAEYELGSQQFLQDAFGGEVAASKVQALATTSFTHLKGITSDMEAKLQVVFANAIAKGTSVKDVAKEIEATVTGISKTRAKALAQYEIIKAHAEGQLDSFEKLDVGTLGVLAEFSTAGDGKVCPKCKDLEGNVYTVKEARGLIPAHVNCRCSWLPAMVGEDGGKQKMSPAAKAAQAEATAADKAAEEAAAAKAAEEAAAAQAAAEAALAKAAASAAAKAAEEAAALAAAEAAAQAKAAEEAAAAKAAEEAAKKKAFSDKVKAGMAAAKAKKEAKALADKAAAEAKAAEEAAAAKAAAEAAAKAAEEAAKKKAFSDKVKAGMAAAKAKKAAATTTPPPIPAADDTGGLTLDQYARLEYKTTLSGSTRPKLMADTATGKQWVIKEGSHFAKGHLESEAAADAMYRAAGFDVPLSGKLTTAEGSIKWSEFISGGQTYGEWLPTATPAEKEAMRKKLQKGFVMDALMSNYDVAGLGNDNILIANGTPYRIDNGGAMSFRAQGKKKDQWAAAVPELATLRDPKINANTAAMFAGLTDDDVHTQIRELLGKRDAILAAMPPGSSDRAVIAQRLAYLEGLLPKAATPTQAATKAPPVPGGGITPALVEGVKKAGLNGVAYKGDRSDIEDNNILVFEDTKGVNLTMKLTLDGSTKVATALGVDANESTTTQPKYESMYYAIKSGYITVNKHEEDKKYNEATLKFVQQCLSELEGKPGAEAAYYVAAAKEVLEAHKAQKQTSNKNFVEWKPVATPVRANMPIVKSDKLTIPTNQIQNGKAVGVGARNNECKCPSYDIDLGDGISAKWVPRTDGRDSSDGLAFYGLLNINVPGTATPEVVQRGMAALNTLGINSTAPSKEWDELLYLHRTIYLRKDAENTSYKAIFNDATKTDAEKLALVKSWVRDNYGINVDTQPSYKPEGRLISKDGGHRVWDRWDMGAAEVKELKKYTLIHTIASLSDSVSARMAPAIRGMLASGGELTSTTARLRKGVNLGDTGGASSYSDINTGGASYVFTRIKSSSTPLRGLFFKSEALLRQDMVSYSGDRFGRISAVNERATTVAQWKANAKSASNEAIFKHGLNLVHDIDHINTGNEAHRQEIISAYKEAGYAVLPDGRKIEDIVKVTR
jgi:SPP1 gp7 family putative phage head morphogenesis protein